MQPELLTFNHRVGSAGREHTHTKPYATVCWCIVGRIISNGTRADYSKTYDGGHFGFFFSPYFRLNKIVILMISDD